MTPPFIGTTAPVLPPVTGSIPAPSMDMEVMTPYQQGSFCFGLDTGICGMLPETVLKVPIRDVCKSVTNIVCALGVLIILVVVLGIAVQGLIQ